MASAAHAEREVIVSAGAINSPQILMLSGIGEPQALAAHGIAVKAALPSVGQNLQDHAAALLIYGRAGKSPLVSNMRADRLALGVAEAFTRGTGFMTDLPGGITGFVKTDPSKPMPDIQLLFIAGSLTAAPYLPPFRSAFPDSFACRIVLLRPESRGSITLRSGDPMDHPRIYQGLLSTIADWKTLREGIVLFRELARRPDLKPFVAREIGPGSEVATDLQLEIYTRQTAVTAHHPAGTVERLVLDPVPRRAARLRARDRALPRDGSLPRGPRLSLAHQPGPAPAADPDLQPSRLQRAAREEAGSLQDPGLAREWRDATRWAFTEALRAGFFVTEFARTVAGKQGPGNYLLEKGSVAEHVPELQRKPDGPS